MATILIADDDQNTRSLVQTVLTHAGHRVVEAKDAAEALNCAVTHVPDLILLDLSMPGASGAELLRALRADATTEDVTVALYTATPMNATLRDFVEIYGITGVVPKPSEPLELLAAVEAAMRRT